MFHVLKTIYKILAGIVRVVKAKGVEPSDEATKVINMLVTQAQLEINSQIQTDVGRITTSVTFMGIDLTAITLLAAIQPIVGSHWWWPGIPLLGSAGALLVSVQGERLEPGPPIRDFYEKYGQASSIEAHTAMLSQLAAAIEANRKSTLRGLWSSIGYSLSALSVVVAGFTFAVYPAMIAHHHSPHTHHAQAGSRQPRSHIGP